MKSFGIVLLTPLQDFQICVSVSTSLERGFPTVFPTFAASLFFRQFQSEEGVWGASVQIRWPHGVRFIEWQVEKLPPNRFFRAMIQFFLDSSCSNYRWGSGRWGEGGGWRRRRRWIGWEGRARRLGRDFNDGVSSAWQFSRVATTLCGDQQLDSSTAKCKEMTGCSREDALGNDLWIFTSVRIPICANFNVS